MLPRFLKPGSLNVPAALPSVTMDEVLKDLIGPSGAKGERKLTKWATEERPLTSPILSGYVHRKIFALRPSDVAPLLEPPMKDWPFPKAPKGQQNPSKDNWAIKALDNITSNIPLVLVFHAYVEKTGRVPTWPQAWEWLNTTEMQPEFMIPAWDKWKDIPAKIRPSKDRWELGILWRLGNSYLSFIREIEFFVRLRHRYGIDLRYHIVADAVFSVDFWSGRHLICLWMINDFKDRKNTASDYFDGSAGFRHHDLIFPRPVMGKDGWTAVKIVTEEDAAALAEKIKSGSSEDSSGTVLTAETQVKSVPPQRLPFGRLKGFHPTGRAAT